MVQKIREQPLFNLLLDTKDKLLLYGLSQPNKYSFLNSPFMCRWDFGEVNMNYEMSKPVSLYCPNCGHKLTGYKDDKGGTRIVCDRCKVVMYSKQMSKKKETIIKVVSR